MTDLTPNNFSFKTEFTISDVLYELELSYLKVEEEGKMVERQIISIGSVQMGVTMTRTEVKNGQPEFRMVGEGILEEVGEEQLMEIVRKVQDSVGEIELSLGQFLGLAKFVEILNHFLNVGLSGEDDELAMAFKGFSDEDEAAINKPAIFLGVTSGSILTGFSIGMLLSAEDYQPWLSIITGVVGTSLLGFFSYKFWIKN